MKKVKVWLNQSRFEYHHVTSKVSDERFLQLCEKAVPLKIEVVEDGTKSPIRPMSFTEFMTLCWALANRYE